MLFNHAYAASFIRRGGLERADIRLSAAGEPEGGRGPVRDDGVCLTTVRPALGRDYKGGVSRQASSRHGDTAESRHGARHGLPRLLVNRKFLLFARNDRK